MFSFKERTLVHVPIQLFSEHCHQCSTRWWPNGVFFNLFFSVHSILHPC